MNLEFYTTRDKTLQKYIEGYYFISENQNSAPFHYWTFPNNFFILSVNQNTEICMEQRKMIIKSSLEENIVADYVASYSKPIEVSYVNPVNEMTFYFKPLGIHHFIADTKPLFINKMVSQFIPFSDFTAKMREIFMLTDRKEQIEKIEKYWLSKLLDKQASILDDVLIDIESDLRIDEIARKYNFSRQYLHKLFIANIGKSPIEYRKIHRFRNSITDQGKSKNLTELTYNNSFYDQSHFIKDFKQFTNISPNTFFQKVDTSKENIWLFI